MHSFVCLPSFVIMILIFIHAACISRLFHFIAESVALYGYTKFHSFIHLFTNSCVVPSFHLLKVKLIWTFGYIFFIWICVSFSFLEEKIHRNGKAPSLGRWVFNSIRVTLFSKVAILFYIPTRSVLIFISLPTFSILSLFILNSLKSI